MNMYKAAIERYNLPPEVEDEMRYAKGDDSELDSYFGFPFVQANILAGRLALKYGFEDAMAISYVP